MIRYLIIGAVLYLAVLLLRRLYKQLHASSDRARNQGNQPTQATARCAHCGVFIPRSQALQAGANHYCSREHMQATSKSDES